MSDTYRFLGLDYGTKTVGVAISDPLLMSATPVETIWRERENKLRKTLARIEALVAEYQIKEVVLGLPLNMDDSFGDRANKTLEFKAMLEKRLGIQVNMYDERLSSFEAHELMRECGIKDVDHKKQIDKIAAMVILQGFLDDLGEDKKKELLEGESSL